MAERLLGIQAARGGAAILVTVYHGGSMVSLPQYVGYNPTGEWFRFGHAGVDFFFVLSGFIIYFVHRGDFGRPERLGRYLWRRVTRVYPMYWLLTLVVVALALASPGGHHAMDFWYMVKSVLLLPQIGEPMLGVGWTLVYEVFFYTMFAVAIANGAAGVVAFGVWAGLLVLGLMVYYPVYALQFASSSYHFQFFIGMAVAFAVMRWGFPVPRLIAVIGGVAFLAVGLAENAGAFEWAGTASQILFGLAAGVIIGGLASAERAGALRAGPVAAWLGAISYVLYLSHVIVIGLTARALGIVGVVQVLPGWIVLVATTLTALAVAGGLHRYVERPVLAWARR